MGRQAKRKKRRQQNSELSAPQPINEQDFVRDFTHRGYPMGQVARSPELPDTDPQPEV